MRRKRQKTNQEELTHPDEYVYDKLQTQEEITEKVVNFYIDPYKNHETCPDYQEIVNTLSPGQIKLLSESIDEISSALKKTKNNTAPGASGLGGSFYQMFWQVLNYVVVGALH